MYVFLIGLLIGFIILMGVVALFVEELIGQYLFFLNYRRLPRLSLEENLLVTRNFSGERLEGNIPKSSLSEPEDLRKSALSRLVEEDSV